MFNVSMKKLTLIEIKILLYMTPMMYLLGKVTNNQTLYAFKDAMMLLLCINFFLFKLIKFKKNKDTYTVFFLLIIGWYIITNSILQMTDFTFWAISIREVVFTPLACILIGMFLRSERVALLDYFGKTLIFICIITFLFSIVFPAKSYRATGRLASFWDREHEPAIIGVLTILYIIGEYIRQKNFDIKLMVISVIALYCVVRSGSRSAFIALFCGIVYLFYGKLNLKKFLLLTVICLIFYAVVTHFSQITNRSLDYNLKSRNYQYEMALSLFGDSPFFGIGIDKYGVLAGRSKTLSFNGRSTTTMDSTILKYLTNLGLVFIVMRFLFLKRCYYNAKIYKIKDIVVFIIAGIIFGSVTGKLGAYPLNQFYYICIGYLSLYNDITPAEIKMIKS